MAGSQKVFLRIVGLIGDSADADEMPDRVNVTGRGRLVPTIAAGAGDVAQGPDSLHEIRLIEPVPFEIIDGMLTYDAKPYVWLPVPTGEWMWRITFDQVSVGGQLRELRDFLFPLEAATPAQVADQGYPGINLAQYGIGAWEPGTVNLTAQAISQITIYLGRASNAAGDAEQSRQEAAAAESRIGIEHDHIHQDVNHADTHAIAAGAASDIATTKASEANASAGVATTKAAEAAQHRADTLGFRNTAQGAATTATTKAGEASVSAQTATTKAAQTAIDALTLAQRVAGGAREIKRTSDGKPYLLPESEVSEVDLRVDTTVGTRVFLGDVMIHGDVSKRDLRSLLPADCTASAFHISLDGNIVVVAIVDLVSTVGGDIFLTEPLPVGFRPWPRHRFPAIGASLVNVDTAGGLKIYGTSPNASVNGTFAFRTPNSWPTSLPGIPV